MKTRHVVSMIGLCIMIAACSRQDSVFARSPVFRERTAAKVSEVAECIAARWKNGTREFSRVKHDGAVRLRAETYFKGVTIGVSVRQDAGSTLVEYFERRVADPLYATMVRGCLNPS
ncbi:MULTISPECIES: hypothetical protein [unclassified Caballeronia]|uniref:hypothetical protein n=1 Tax=unclassified Caballeronia TaxID=2646786 RepID=UPI002862F2F6|nr:MULTISPECIES: hypothetical protein [unclassified Caballeronia]MDR5815756.1 hypothetical protein [Caballeronia sp. LZ033]MDR5823716.1 hypothetical protein [Caballeronia sp. LZ043]MDR5884247.1 hypothetical protein [Caballeronia sp. LZ032]